jgi:hypothetical protein
LAALPSKFVEYLKMEEVFKLPYELYTWGEIYSLITKTLVGLCTSMKIQNSVSKSSYLPDQKSICEQYGLYLSNPARKEEKSLKTSGEKKGENIKLGTSMFLKAIIMSQKILGSNLILMKQNRE